MIESPQGDTRLVSNPESMANHDVDHLLQPLVFPPDFNIGAATSDLQTSTPGSYPGQIAPTDFAALWRTGPERIPWEIDTDGNPVEIGPDWWNPNRRNAEADLNRMYELGIRTARISIEWARIEPRDGEFDEAAIRRYAQIFNFMKHRGIEPVIALQHFALPEWLKDGWHNPRTPELFERYAEKMAIIFGNEEVKKWITLNEPTGELGGKYFSEYFPPGKRQLRHLPHAVKNMSEANRRAYVAIKRHCPDAEVGITHAMMWVEPNDPNSTREKKLASALNWFNNYLPILLITGKGHYADFLGVNFYTAHSVSGTHNPRFEKGKSTQERPLRNIPFFNFDYQGQVPSDFGWTMAPDSFLRAIREIHQRYPGKVFVTENGYSTKGDDDKRKLFFIGHLAAIHKAISEGIPIRGWHVWSLIKNLEWAQGFDQDFGIIGYGQAERGTRAPRHVRESGRFIQRMLQDTSAEDGVSVRRNRPVLDLRREITALRPELQEEALHMLRLVETA